jgi:hypothetical protein
VGKGVLISISRETVKHLCAPLYVEFLLAKDQAPSFGVNLDGLTRLDAAVEEFHGQRIQDFSLDKPLQRARPIHRIVASQGEMLFRAVCQHQGDVIAFEALTQLPYL